MVESNHDCRSSFQERLASAKTPYHFVDSGLPHVYLAGIKYRVCRACKKQAADIPAVKSLLTVIARAIVESDAPLTGPEIRFIRKRLGLPSAEFARLIGVSLEQVSRWENDWNRPEKSADKLIRMAYCHLSGDRELKSKFEKDIAAWLSGWGRKVQLSEIRAKLRKNEWEAESVVA